MPPRPRTPRPRTPSPEEAGILTVYLDAERALLEVVTRETGAIADLAQAGADTSTAQAAGAGRVRDAVQRTVTGLDRDGPARIERIVAAAADGGVDEAVRQLGAVSGRGAGTDRGDTINRGALDRLAASTLDLVGPAHSAILRTVPDAFRDVITRTTAPILVGAQTRQEAAQRAMWALTDRGLTSFTDSGGRKWRLSSYVEMATRTAAARAHVDAQLDRLAADGQDLVMVSEAAGECKRCAPWEGKILAQSGPTGSVEVEHALNDGEMVVVDVAGTVDQARRAGLLHPNCRHSLSAYLPGLTRALEKVRDPDLYAASQRQREIERHIRAWREREAAAITPEARRLAAAKVKGWQGSMRDHLKANTGLRRQSYREGIDGGNAPTDALRARLAGRGPIGPAVAGRARTPRQMNDAELDRRMAGALGREDFDEFERLAGETDRRDAARTARRDRDQETRDRREAEKGAEFDRLLAAGRDEEEAAADAFGVSIERQRRDAARARLEGDGYTGSFKEMTRASFTDQVEQEMVRAEDGGRVGALLRRGTPPRVTAKQLWTGNEKFARRWASDELKEWWDVNGRLTYDQHVDGLLNGSSRGGSSGGDFFS